MAKRFYLKSHSSVGDYHDSFRLSDRNLFSSWSGYFYFSRVPLRKVLYNETVLLKKRLISQRLSLTSKTVIKCQKNKRPCKKMSHGLFDQQRCTFKKNVAAVSQPAATAVQIPRTLMCCFSLIVCYWHLVVRRIVGKNHSEKVILICDCIIQASVVAEVSLERKRVCLTIWHSVKKEKTNSKTIIMLENKPQMDAG